MLSLKNSPYEMTVHATVPVKRKLMLASKAYASASRVNWIILEYLEKARVNQLIKLSAHLFKLIAFTVMLDTHVLYTSIGPQIFEC